MFTTIDDAWREHLREMDDLRQSVQNATYEQKDPLLIYKFESFRTVLEDARQGEPRGAERSSTRHTSPCASRAPRRCGASSRSANGCRSSGSGAPRWTSISCRRRGCRPPRRPDSRIGRNRCRCTSKEGGPQRSLPLRIGQEVQELPRKGVVAPSAERPESTEVQRDRKTRVWVIKRRNNARLDLRYLRMAAIWAENSLLRAPQGRSADRQGPHDYLGRVQRHAGRIRKTSARTNRD